MNSWTRLNFNKDHSQAELMSRKLSYNIPKQNDNFMCPSCKLEIKIRDLVERKGSIGCINCVR